MTGTTGRRTATKREAAGLVLRRRTLVATPPPPLDPAQAAAVAHRGGPLRVLGAPGTGKTLVVVESVVARVEDGVDPGAVLVLAPARLAAADLRQRVTGRLRRTVREPTARTPHSFAFGVLRLSAALSGEAAPRLLNGPEQDVVLRELLAGHAEGQGRDPGWPASVRPALAARGLRAELRDLLMRAVERGVTADHLADLGRTHDRPEWVAAASLLQEYDEVTALATPGAFDPAAIVDAAAAALQTDPDLLDRVRASARVVVVDDAQELTPAAMHLVEVIAGGGGEVVVVGDPDATTQSFRGADPGLLDETALAGLAGLGREVRTVRLGTSWRQGPGLLSLTGRVAERVGAVAGTAHRHPQPAPGLPEGAVEVRVLASAAQEAAHVAHLLRREHLEHGRPWRRMAVVVRGSARAATLRRVLAGQGVPVQVPATELPVRDHAAVVPLLDAYRVALDVAEGRDGALDVETAVGLLTSPLGGADAVALRRLRRALRGEELGGGGGRTSDELLVEALLRPSRLVGLDPMAAAPARRVARVLAAGVEAAAVREVVAGPPGDAADGEGGEGRRFERGATAESVLWALWEASGLARPWQRAALGGGASGLRADRDLDAVLGLFDAAARFVDRLPDAGPMEFLEHLRAQEVPGDTLVDRSPSDDAVSLVTPQGAVGRDWDVVVVAGVQEGVWPDLRLRGSLLGSQALVDVLGDRGRSVRAAQAAVRHDELRMLHVAVSRAAERLVVTAVQDEDQQPSSFVELVLDHLDQAAEDSTDPDGGDEVVVSTPGPPLSLPGLVAELRRVVSDPGAADDDPRVVAAAAALARLAAAGVPGAHPDTWYGLAAPSDEAPLVEAGAPVRLSPSAVESVQRCALRWLLEQSGGRGPSSLAQGVGTLVHDIAADLPDGDTDSLAAELERRWPALRLPSGWVADAQRDRAGRMVAKLAAYVSQAAAEGWELVDVERAFEVPVGAALVTGRVDRLERHPDGGLRVVDLKTGKTKPTVADVKVHAQLGVYQAAVEEGAFAEGRTSAGAALAQLGSTEQKLTVQPQPRLADAEEPRWAHELVDAAARASSAAVFPATANDLCSMCPVRSSCPVQPEGRTVTG